MLYIAIATQNPCYLAKEVMTTPQIVTVAGNACALILSALLIAGGIIGVDLKQMINRRFLTMLLFTIAGSVFEILLSLMTTASVPEFLVHAADFLDFTCASCVIISFSLYKYELISSKASVSIKPFLIGAGLSALNIPLAAAKMIVLTVGVDGGYTQISVQVSTILPILCVFISVSVTLRYIRLLRPREWGSLLLYPVIPVLGAFVQIFVPDVWLSFLGVAISLFLIYMNIQVELGRRVLEQELELTESHLSVMLSQIQPHFLYNALAAIEDLCDADIEKAKTAINDFAHYLRGNLESVAEKRMIPFEDELEHVETYLSLEKLRFGDKMRLVYDIQATDFLLPPLTIQPIAENAVRHGIMKKGGTVMIRAERTENAHIITVEDDGAGFDPAEPLSGEKTHVGIANVRERLKALCGGTLTIESIPGIRTQCHITIPFREEDAP